MNRFLSIWRCLFGLMVSAVFCVAQPKIFTPDIIKPQTGNNVDRVEVVDAAPDGGAVTLVMQYSYDGFGGPTAQLLPIIEKRDQKEVSVFFGANPQTIGQGRGQISMRVRFFNDEPGSPGEITTDRIRVLFLNSSGRAVISSSLFLKNIHWGHAGAKAKVEATDRIKAETKSRQEAEARQNVQAEKDRAKAEEERQRAEVKVREAAKLKAEAEARERSLKEEAAKAEAIRLAEQQARQQAEVRRQAEETRLAKERAKAAEDSKRAAEAKAREEARLKAEAEARERDLKESAAKAEARRQAEAQAQKEAEAKRLAEDHARLETAAKAEAQAGEAARLKAEEEARRFADELAKAEEEVKRMAVEKRQAETKARQEAEGQQRAQAEAEKALLAQKEVESRAIFAPPPPLKPAVQEPPETLASLKTRITNVDIVNRSLDRSQATVAVEYEYKDALNKPQLGVDVLRTGDAESRQFFKGNAAEINKSRRNFVLLPVKFEPPAAQKQLFATYSTDRLLVYLMEAASNQKLNLFAATVMLKWRAPGALPAGDGDNAETALELDELKQNTHYSGYVTARYNLKSGPGRLVVRLFDSRNPASAEFIHAPAMKVQPGNDLQLLEFSVKANAAFAGDILKVDTLEITLEDGAGSPIGRITKSIAMELRRSP